MDNTHEKEAEILAVFADSSRFPNIPKDLIEHIRLCIQNKSNNRLIESLLADVERTTIAIDRMFHLASMVTGLSPNELLKRTDFNYHDLSPTRHESAFAEIRAINFLHNEGFTDIKPLESRGKKKVDIVAKKDTNKYAIEVVNSIFNAENRFSSEELRDWVIGRIDSDRKTDQIAKTITELNCQRGILIAIVDSRSELLVHDDFFKVSEMVWKELGESPLLHICFVTGRESLGYGSDDSTYPPWPATS